MSIFRKKCEYCRNKIEKEREVNKNVKVPGFMGTYSKNFCSEEHASEYEREVEEHLKRSKGGNCCG